MGRKNTAINTHGHVGYVIPATKHMPGQAGVDEVLNQLVVETALFTV